MPGRVLPCCQPWLPLPAPSPASSQPHASLGHLPPSPPRTTPLGLSPQHAPHHRLSPPTPWQGQAPRIPTPTLLRTSLCPVPVEHVSLEKSQQCHRNKATPVLSRAFELAQTTITSPFPSVTPEEQSSTSPGSACCPGRARACCEQSWVEETPGHCWSDCPQERGLHNKEEGFLLFPLYV